jgi:hypothetical protein
MHAVARVWSDEAGALDWAPFVHELERQRAHDAGLPGDPDSLELFSVLDSVGVRQVEFSVFRFAPVFAELLGSPGEHLRDRAAVLTPAFRHREASARQTPEHMRSVLEVGKHNLGRASMWSKVLGRPRASDQGPVWGIG